MAMYGQILKGLTGIYAGREQRKFGREEAKLGEAKYQQQLADFRAGKFDAEVSGEMAKTRADATRLAAQASRRATDRAAGQQQQLLAGAGRGDVRGLAAAAGQARQLEMGAQQAQQAGAQTILGAQQEFGKYSAGVQARNESQRSQLEAMELARGAARFDAGRLTQQEGLMTMIEGTGRAAMGATTSKGSGTFGSGKGNFTEDGGKLDFAESGMKVKGLKHPEAFWGALIKLVPALLGKLGAAGAVKGGAAATKGLAAAKGAAGAGKGAAAVGKGVAAGGGGGTEGLLKGLGSVKSGAGTKAALKSSTNTGLHYTKGNFPSELKEGKMYDGPKTIEGAENPKIKDPLGKDKPEDKPEDIEKEENGQEGEENGKEGEKEEKEEEKPWEAKKQDISRLLSVLSAPSSNFARSIGQKPEDKDFMKDGGYVGENGGVTEGEFSHEKNPIDMTNEDGEKVGEVTGGEYVFNEEQSNLMQELVERNEPEMLIKFMRELLSQPQFN